MAKLNREEFVIQAIKMLRKGRQKGLTTATAGLQEAFQHQYGDNADLFKTTSKMQAAGKLVLRPNGKPGHLTMYLPDEAPKMKRTAADVLAAMGVKPRKPVVSVS